MASTRTVLVLTCDQRASRRRSDAVPAALAALTPADLRHPPLLRPERTAGDEFQTVYEDAAGVVEAVETLTRLREWRIGIGIGAAQAPLPSDPRSARGPAFVAARNAVEAAHTTAAQLAVRTTPHPDGAERSGVGLDDHRPLRAAEAAEHALTLLVAVLARRSDAGWETVELVEQGMTGRQVAARLGISESAVSQRLARAGREEQERGRALAVDLLRRAWEDA